MYIYFFHTHIYIHISSCICYYACVFKFHVDTCVFAKIHLNIMCSKVGIQVDICVCFNILLYIYIFTCSHMYCVHISRSSF